MYFLNFFQKFAFTSFDGYNVCLNIRSAADKET